VPIKSRLLQVPPSSQRRTFGIVAKFTQRTTVSIMLVTNLGLARLPGGVCVSTILTVPFRLGAQQEKFEMGLLNSSDWKASWIGNTAYVLGSNSLPVFAKTFSVSCPTTQSRLYLLGLGAHSATINGARSILRFSIQAILLSPRPSTIAPTTSLLRSYKE
jgi:hypothetical protein